MNDYAELAKACRVLQADLDAAQDEIERLISEKEELRAHAMPSKEQLMDVIHVTLHPTCDGDPDCLDDIYTGEEIADSVLAIGGVS